MSRFASMLLVSALWGSSTAAWAQALSVRRRAHRKPSPFWCNDPRASMTAITTATTSHGPTIRP